MFGTYKCSFILLDEISVLSLVLLHLQLGVLHVKVVCQVVYYIEETNHCSAIKELSVQNDVQETKTFPSEGMVL